MVEIMSQNDYQEMLKLPKNIRQIGLPEEKKKIYIEDYVVTYMNQLASEYPNRQSAAVLLGFHTRQKDTRLTFINGAVGIESARVEDDCISFGSEMWEEIYNDVRKYFHTSEIIGWFLTRPGKSLGINEKITKIHVDQFPGKDKALFLMDPLDKEEAFFIYEGGKLTKQHGYYIYYERNEEMQNYMIDHRKIKGTEELTETADLKNTAHMYRYSQKQTERTINEKNTKKRYGKKVLGSAAAALALVVIGMNAMNLLYTSESAQMVGGRTNEEISTIKIIEDSERIMDEDVEFTETEGEMEAWEVNADSGVRYTVQKGDTLVNICIGLYNSQAYMDLICEMNGIDDPNLIYEGMVLELP